MRGNCTEKCWEKKLFKSSRSKFANQKTKFLMYCVCLCVWCLWKINLPVNIRVVLFLSLYWSFRTYSGYTFFPLHNIALFMQLQWQPITSGRWDMGLWKSVLRNSTAFRKGWTMVNSSVWKALGLRGEAGQKSMANLMLEKFKHDKKLKWSKWSQVLLRERHTQMVD